MEESKDKIVNFRVTNQEYVSYCRACSAAGLDNLSEMFRVALNQFVGQGASEQAGRRVIENPGLPALPSGLTPQSDKTENGRTVHGPQNGSVGKWLGASPAKEAKGNI
jgi:hypothetical protein